MDDAALVGADGWPGSATMASRPCSCGGGGGLPAEACAPAAALDELQREVRRLAVLADLVDLHDVGVLQPGDGLGLAAEAAERAPAGHGAPARIILGRRGG